MVREKMEKSGQVHGFKSAPEYRSAVIKAFHEHAAQNGLDTNSDEGRKAYQQMLSEAEKDVGMYVRQINPQLVKEGKNGRFYNLQTGEMIGGDMPTEQQAEQQGLEARTMKLVEMEKRANPDLDVAKAYGRIYTSLSKGTEIGYKAGVIEINQSRADTYEKKTTAPKGITENQKINLIGKAAAAGVDPDSPEFMDESGQTDMRKLAVAYGQAKQSIDAQKRQDASAKLPAHIRDKVGEIDAGINLLAGFNQELLRLQASGGEPSNLDRILLSSLDSDPNTMFSSAMNMIKKNAISPNAKDLDIISRQLLASVSFAQGGKAFTEPEKRLIAGFTPQRDDSFEDLARKGTGLENFLMERRRAFVKESPSSPEAGGTAAPSTAKPTAPGAGEGNAGKVRVRNRQTGEVRWLTPDEANRITR